MGNAVKVVAATTEPAVRLRMVDEERRERLECEG